MTGMHCYAITDPSGTLRIVLPMPTPSLNEWNGRRWYAKAKIKRTWWDAIALLLGMRVVSTATTKRSVTIERHAPRMLDHDNAWAGVKPILDALVTLGLLVDDAPKWCDLHVSQHKTGRGEPPHTVIVIEDALSLGEASGFAPGATRGDKA